MSRSFKPARGEKPLPPPNASPDLAIQGDSLSLHPPASASEPGNEQELIEPYAKFRAAPIGALQGLGKHVSGTGWRSYDKIVGTEIFYPGFSEKMKAKVMSQAKLKRKIGELAQKRVEVELEEGRLGPLGLDGEVEEWRERRDGRRRELEIQLEGVAEGWTDNMICKMDSRYFIRGAYYLATQLLTRAYHQGIHVNSEEVVRLRAVAEEAEKQQKPIVFLPCHRSHVDYVSLQVICYRLGLALPTVVAGDNLNVPVLGPFLQHAGAMWIRRSFGEDVLYTTLVQAYIDSLLQNGHNLECFIEGGRSRTGKLLQPKFGILSFVLDSVLSGTVPDAIICPVSTQYDKVIEVDSYISELLGQPKPKENFLSFLSASNVLSLKLGRVDMRFHEPWSLRDFVTEQTTRLSPQPSTTTTADLRRRLLSTLGYRVLKEINDVSVVMPTALVGTVLLTLHTRGIGKTALLRRITWLSARVRAQGGRIAHFSSPTTATVIDRALEVLGPNLVGRVPGLPEETFYAQDRFQLSFYRNMTIHLFLSQALVCCAVHTRLTQADPTPLSYPQLRDYVAFLSSLFRAEFIFDTRPLDESLVETLRGLETDGVLQLSSSSSDSRIETIALHPAEQASGRENFDFYCFLIWPFVEAAWLGAVSLFMLSPPAVSNSGGSGGGGGESWTELSRFQRLAQLLGKTLYHQGQLSYFEAVNKEALKNAFERQVAEGVVVVDKGKGCRLADGWVPSRGADGKLRAEGRLWGFCERVQLGRREGGRGARVLETVEMVGQMLWEGEGGTGGVKL